MKLQDYRYEYRINKKGCECFRTECRQQAEEKLVELRKKNPRIYTLQYRACPVNKVGTLLTYMENHPMWTPWREA